MAVEVMMVVVVVNQQGIRRGISLQGVQVAVSCNSMQITPKKLHTPIFF